MTLNEMAEMVKGMLTRSQMIHGFIENDLLTEEVMNMTDDEMATEVAKNLLNDLEG